MTIQALERNAGNALIEELVKRSCDDNNSYSAYLEKIGNIYHVALMYNDSGPVTTEASKYFSDEGLAIRFYHDLRIEFNLIEYDFEAEYRNS